MDKIMFALYDLCGKPTPPPAPLTEIRIPGKFKLRRTPLWNHRLQCLGADSNLPSAAFAKG